MFLLLQFLIFAYFLLLKFNYRSLNPVFGLVWVDALRPRSTAKVMSGRSIILSTLFLGKPPRGM